MAQIAVKDLCANPFRSLERYPIRRDKVDALKASIRSTDFWDNLVARPSPNGQGGYEIAYGHHRLVALQEVGVVVVDIPVRDLDDETMLKILAYENMEEWGANAVIEQETIRTAVLAFADGKIKLPKVAPKDMRGGGFRVAPNFGLSREKSKIDGKAYTVATLAKFLGWPKANVGNTLHALAMIEEGKDIDFAGLSPKQAEAVVRETRFAEKKSGDKTIAAEVGVKLADEFRSISGDGRSKKDVSIHTARDRTERLLRENRVERFVAKRCAEMDKAELESFDHQVKEFLDAHKVWMTAIEAATKAISKFSPEGRKFAIRRLDQSVAAENELKASLT